MVRLIILRLLESYFRHRWLYLLPCVLMAIAGSYYISLQPPTYRARGTLYVQNQTLLSTLSTLPSSGYSWVTPAQATVNELYQLLNSDAFLRAIIERTDLEVQMNQGPVAVGQTIAEAKQALWFQSLGNNMVLVGAVHEMPRISHQLVSSTIETFIQWKINLSRDDSVAAQEFFNDLIATYGEEVVPARQALAAYLAEHPKPVRGERSEEEVSEIARLQAAVDVAEERLRNAENKEESARLALVQTERDVRQSFSVIDAPVRPLSPERSKKEMALTLAIFLVAGIMISAIGIVGGALLDTSFRFPIDVQQGLRLPVLALITESRSALIPAPRVAYQTPDYSMPYSTPERARSTVKETTVGSVTENGDNINGVTVNGATVNSTTINGATANGTTVNGATINNVTANGTATNGANHKGPTPHSNGTRRRRTIFG
ncbi:MAG: hypothetical protein R3C14_41555 [Caldilineaceae bacterium]